jgi:hypothetical protein
MWSSVEFLGDVLEVLGPVGAEVGALGEVVEQQPVDASMAADRAVRDGYSALP